MKNWKKFSIATLGTLSILGTTVLAATGTVNAPSGLVLREEASKTSNPITTVPDKAEVNIVEKNGEWYKVEYSSHEGFLFAEYVNTEEEVTEETTDEETSVEETTTEDTNKIQTKLKVYNMPLITSTIINEIEANAEITVIKEITNWSYVIAGDIQGWVRTYGIENPTQIQDTEPSKGEEQPKPEEPAPENPVDDETEEPTEEQEEPVEEQTEQENPITEPSNTAQTETTVTEIRGYINVESATVRARPTTDSDVVTYLIKDTSFTITAETEEWYKIRYTSIDDEVYEGYIYKELVTK